MAIKTITRTAQAGIPRIARIRKGAPKPERGPGRDLDYFRVEFEPGFEHLAEPFAQMYGAEPKKLGPLYLVGADVDTAFSSWLEEWATTGLLKRCDGENIVMRFDKSLGFVDSPIPCQKATSGCKCQKIGRLAFMLPAFTEATGVLGQFLLTTSSFGDIQHITSFLTFIQETMGRVNGMPFEIERADREFTYVKRDKGGAVTGDRGKSTRAMLAMQIVPEYAKAMLLPVMTAYQLPEGVDPETGEIYMIEAPKAPELPAPKPQAPKAPAAPPQTIIMPKLDPAADWLSTDDGKAEMGRLMAGRGITNTTQYADLLDYLQISSFGEYPGDKASFEAALDAYLAGGTGGDDVDLNDYFN